MFPGSEQRKVESEKCEEEHSYSSLGEQDPINGDKTTVIAIFKTGDRVFGAGGASIQGLANATGSGKPVFVNTKSEYQSALTKGLLEGDVITTVHCHGGRNDRAGGGIRTNAGWMSGQDMADAISGALSATGADPSQITMLDGACYGCRGAKIEEELKKDGYKNSINYLASSGFHEQSRIVEGVTDVLGELGNVLRADPKFRGRITLGHLKQAQIKLQSAYSLQDLKRRWR